MFFRISTSYIAASTRFFFFFFNDTATTEIYTLSLHDALPISRPAGQPHHGAGVVGDVHRVHPAAQQRRLAPDRAGVGAAWRADLGRHGEPSRAEHLPQPGKGRLAGAARAAHPLFLPAEPPPGTDTGCLHHHAKYAQKDAVRRDNRSD